MCLDLAVFLHENVLPVVEHPCDVFIHTQRK
jgi:hypothetical protein